MPTSPARTADDIADTLRTLVDRVVEAKFTQEMAKRGQDVAGLLAERGADLGDLATDAWKDSRSARRDAARRLARATDDASKWSTHTWRRSLRPMLKDLWSQRALAAGAAGAAVPAGKELVDSAAARLGLRQRQEARHWGAFFLGLLLGAAGGAIAALLTTPKRGDEMRQELGARADEVRREVTAKADELATKARDEWVPLFQSDATTNGHGSDAADAVTDPFGETPASVTEGAAAFGDPGSDPFTEPVESTTAETAGIGDETYESAEREPTS
jgi:gas vesicle protein